MAKNINDDELVDVAGGTDVVTGLGDSSGSEGASGQKKGDRTGGGAGGGIEEEAPPSGGSSGME